MSAHDPRVDAYIATSAPFARPILEQLRGSVHAACPSVQEDIKWSMPSFQYGGRILCQMAAFKQHASFGFWQHATVTEGKARDGMGSLGRLETIKDVPSKRDLTALLRKAMALIDEGATSTATRAKPAPRAALRCAEGAGRPARCTGRQRQGEGDVRQLQPQCAPRLYRMDHRGQARGHARTSVGASGRVDGGRQNAELEVRQADMSDRYRRWC